METKNTFTIVVEYYSDPTKMIDDHESEPIYLTEINERLFDDIFEAIKFLSVCINPITNVEDLISIPKKPKGFKFIIPEQHIKIKHQANSTLDLIIDELALDWG